MPRRKYSSDRLTHTLTGLGISLTAFLLVLGVFLGSLALIKLLRSFIEERINAVVTTAKRAAEAPVPQVPSTPEGPQVPSTPEEPKVVSKVEPSSSLPREGLIFASFSDLFSSTAELDAKGTTMYRDDAATAFLFPPKLEWKEVESPLNPIESRDASCIKGSCLSIKGTVLAKDGAVIKLPIEGAIESVTADAVGNEWLVGIVVRLPAEASAEAGKEGSSHAGYAYRYDGRAFAPVFPNEKAFESEYKGAWGFGGTEDDFLAVYGAYQGKGYHVRGNRIDDLSWLFDVRIMKGGITPGMTRVGTGAHTTWYLWNKERNNRPVFLKLFQNGTDDIVGEADLLGTAPQAFSHFILGQSKEVGLPKIEKIPYVLVGYAEQNGVSSAWDIRDEGFKAPPGPVTVTSVNLNNYNAEVPHVLKASFREFSAGGAKITLAVSNQSEDAWEAITAGDGGLWFKNPHGTALKWRMTVTPGTNPEYMPFIGILDLDYEVERL